MPVRSCLGCRCRRPQPELVRITRATSDGVAPILGVDGTSSGRGAWLCRATSDDELIVDTNCLDRALTQRQFDRAWRTKLDHYDVEAIRHALRHDEQRTS